MYTFLTETDAGQAVMTSEHNCPYYNSESGICAASLSRMVIDADRRSGYCTNENYDSCPIFLAKTLRSGPRGF